MNSLTYYRTKLEMLIEEARADGVVLRIDLVPRPPLAMGSYDMTPDVRPHRNGIPQFPHTPPWPAARKTKKGTK